MHGGQTFKEALAFAKTFPEDSDIVYDPDDDTYSVIRLFGVAHHIKNGKTSVTQCRMVLYIEGRIE